MNIFGISLSTSWNGFISHIFIFPLRMCVGLSQQWSEASHFPFINFTFSFLFTQNFSCLLEFITSLELLHFVSLSYHSSSSGNFLWSPFSQNHFLNHFIRVMHIEEWRTMKPWYPVATARLSARAGSANYILQGPNVAFTFFFWIKFYWDTAILIHLHIVCGCFSATAE